MVTLLLERDIKLKKKKVYKVKIEYFIIFIDGHETTFLNQRYK